MNFLKDERSTGTDIFGFVVTLAVVLIILGIFTGAIWYCVERIFS